MPQSDTSPLAARYPPPPANAMPAQKREYERAQWNHFLLDPDWRRTRFNEQPNAWLVAAVQGYKAGKALDINMGEGRNALYLAQHGWQVTGVDIADQALAFAQQRARQLDVQLTTIEHDADTFEWGHSQWDLLVLCYADESAHVAQVQEALKPGGLVVFENFHTDINQVRPAASGQRIGFATDELLNLYTAAGFRIVRYEQPIGIADFSREMHRLVQLVAQKPG